MSASQSTEYIKSKFEQYEFKFSKYFDFEIKYSVDIIVLLVFGTLVGVDNTGDAFMITMAKVVSDCVTHTARNIEDVKEEEEKSVSSL